MNRFRVAVVAGLVGSGLVPAAAAAETPPRSTWVVDRDGVQCGNADFTTIQAAVDAAQPRDRIRVCPDTYPEQVTVDKPLALIGDPESVEAVDCFDPTASQSGDADPARQVIVDPPGDGFTVAFRLGADDIELAGFVIQGASVGVDAADRYSGYRVHHNLIRLNELWGMDFGSEGARESRVEHNCFRENREGGGLGSELDDDTFWSESVGPERGLWNARDLRNARIEHNTSFRNRIGNDGYGLTAAGPGKHELVTFAHNTSREDAEGIALRNATDSAIIGNEITATRFYSINLGGDNDALEIRSNTIRGGRIGIRFSLGGPTGGFVDVSEQPNRDLVVSENEVIGAFVGIDARENSLVDTLITRNTTSDSPDRIGINLLSGNTRNVIRANIADNNATSGIVAQTGATGNRFEYNSMHGNGWLTTAMVPRADARDHGPLLNGMLQNVWVGNACDTDIPAGLICGVG